MFFASSQSAPAATDGQTDESLVQRLRQGDTPAGEALARRYHEPLMRYLQRLSGSDHLAEELCQATWVSVLEHIDKFDLSASGGGFKAWLFRIATNKANDVWRSRGREKAAKQGLKLITDEEMPSAEHRIEGDEQQHQLVRAIQRLPENQREVLMLRYYGDMKFVDIAATIGCPLNTALGRMHKAMINLKRLMEE